MIAGGVVFLLFWLGDLQPWAFALSVHGLSIGLLSVGLIAHARYSDASRPIRLLTRVGVGATVTGLLTVGPLIYIGLWLVGLSAVLERRASIAGAAFLLGSVLYLVAYATGVRLGFEDAPALTGAQQALTVISLVAIAAGCALIGYGRLRAEPVHDQA